MDLKNGGEGSGALRFDVHVHLAGVGTQNSGCWASPAFRRRPTFVALRLAFGITRRKLVTSADQDWVARVSQLVDNSDLDYAVVLGFDGVYDARGHLDLERSQMIVPLDWVFAACERYRNLLPAPSINPLREDALDVLDQAIHRGAVAIKWLPVVQAFDPADRRVRPFLARVADAGIPILVHAGTDETTFATVDPHVGNLQSLVPALELGVRVICAHTAAPVLYSSAPTGVPRLRELLARYDNLWVDNSGLANPARFLHLPRFAADSLLSTRTLHGSDYPVISNSFYYPWRLGLRRVVEIEHERNLLQRDRLVKLGVGFDEASFQRAAKVLANVRRWHASRAR